MTISAPVLVSCNARVDESFALIVDDSSYVIVSKTYNSPGFPTRELEVFKVSLALAGGSTFFPLVPVRVSSYLSDFYLITAFNTSGTIIRMYWNPVTLSLTGNSPIPAETMDIDISTGINQGTAPNAPSFEAIAPNVIDGRTVAKPNCIYLAYCTSTGTCLAQQSFNLGSTWGNTITIENVAPDVRFIKCNILDPSGAKENIQAVLQRDN